MAPDRKGEATAIYTSLVTQYALTSAFHKALARQIVAALLRGDLVEANKALSLLPTPPARVDTTGKNVSASAAKQKLFELYSNARAAAIQDGTLTEDGDDKVDASELAEARRRIASLEDECAHLRGSKPRRLAAPTDKPMAKAAAPQTAPASKSSGSGSKAAPSSSAPKQEPLHRPSEPAWNAWRNAGGDPAPVSSGGGTYGPAPGSDGLPAAGWINKLSQREW